MRKPILCTLSLHRWGTWEPAPLANGKLYWRRKCKRCGQWRTRTSLIGSKK